jgi:hypothetical protein
VKLDAMLALLRRYMVDDPTYLPLATRCLGLMATQMPTEAAAAFMERMTDRLWSAGSGLERHFPTLAPGGGVVLLRRSYALIIGLWQLSSAHAAHGGAPSHCPTGQFDYAQELGVALAALWEGSIGRPLPANTAAPANEEA